MRANKALEPTRMLVTDSAAQAPRQASVRLIFGVRQKDMKQLTLILCCALSGCANSPVVQDTGFEKWTDYQIRKLWDRIERDERAYLKSTAGRRILVLGLAEKVGIFDLPAQSQASLRSVVDMAGGIPLLVDTKRITIERGLTTLVIDLKSPETKGGANVPIIPGDIITFPEHE